MSQAETKYVKIQTKLNRATGLIAAVCDELPGLLVVGRTPGEIEMKLPGAIEEILEANGLEVISVKMVYVRVAARNGTSRRRLRRKPS